MRFVSAALGFLLSFSLLTSCSKEKSFEVDAPATGSLQNDETNDCLPKTAVGSFIAGTLLTDSNYLLVDVNVTTLGSYAIHTDTANGYAFSGMGNFETTGINQVRLMATGTPTAAGTDEFTVFFDSSFCFLPVTVLPAGSSGAAAFTLQGSGDSCILATAVLGTYTQNQALGTTNKVDIKVNTTTAGSYTVTTNTVNGFSFSGSGTLVSPGEHTISLTASGLPTAAGSTVFTVSAGGTTCSFVVTVVASTTPPPATSGVLFPLTAANWWSYSVPQDVPFDTIKVTDRGPVPVNGIPYHLFEFTDADGAFDSIYYRKNGTDYFQPFVLTTNDLPQLESDVSGDVLFLKDNINVNDTWNSDLNARVNGVDVKLRYLCVCTDAAISYPANGRTYTNVYRVTTKLQVGVGSSFTDISGTRESYYAKGVGLIYEKIDVLDAGSYDRTLKNYKVN